MDGLGRRCCGCSQGEGSRAGASTTKAEADPGRTGQSEQWYSMILGAVCPDESQFGQCRVL
jgi:hypothetical protein